MPEPINLTSPRNIKQKYRPAQGVEMHPPRSGNTATAKLNGPVLVISPTGRATMCTYINDKRVD